MNILKIRLPFGILCPVFSACDLFLQGCCHFGSLSPSVTVVCDRGEAKVNWGWLCCPTVLLCNKNTSLQGVGTEIKVVWQSGVVLEFVFRSFRPSHGLLWPPFLWAGNEKWKHRNEATRISQFWLVRSHAALEDLLVQMEVVPWLQHLLVSALLLAGKLIQQQTGYLALLLPAESWVCHVSNGKDGDTLVIHKVLYWIQQAELLEISSLTEFQHHFYTAVSIWSLKDQDARALEVITDSFDF